MLINLQNRITPLTHFQYSSIFKKKQIKFTKQIISLMLRTNHKIVDSYQNNTTIERLYLFSKYSKPNKLFIDNNTGIFLSSGIILRFMYQSHQRFLKKRLKIWYNFLKALKFLQIKNFILIFKDLNGKKSIFLTKLLLSEIKINWIFIKLLNLNLYSGLKKSRRIKRWIKKKYYQLGINERK